MKKGKIIFTWITLIVLIGLLLALNYIKFFVVANPNIEERPVENSSSVAIHTALKEITEQFNQNEELEEYKKNGIQMNAILNQYSIYIHYSEDKETTTYEFDYSNLSLKIKLTNEEKNLAKFYVVYKLLIEACQRRIGTQGDFSSLLDNVLNGEIEWDGVSKNEEENFVIYQLNITKQLKA